MENMFGKAKKGFAGLPSEVIFKSVGSPSIPTPENINDSMQAVDKQISEDGKAMRKNSKK